MTDTYYPPILTILQDDYPHGLFTTRKDYRPAYIEAYRAACQHYDFKVRVEGGWKFFEFATDYQTWKNQK